MNFFTKPVLQIVQLAAPCQLQSVRFRYHAEKIARGKLLKRFGFEEKMLERGLLPHVDGEKYVELPQYRPKDCWNEKRALFGQNDYIDILGNENMHPTKLLYNVPFWLRGFRGNEFQHCLRKSKMLDEGSYRYENPRKWHDLKKRIMYLYKYMNTKTKTGYTNKKSG